MEAEIPMKNPEIRKFIAVSLACSALLLAGCHHEESSSAEPTWDALSSDRQEEVVGYLKAGLVTQFGYANAGWDFAPHQKASSDIHDFHADLTVMPSTSSSSSSSSQRLDSGDYYINVDADSAALTFNGLDDEFNGQNFTSSRLYSGLTAKVGAPGDKEYPLSTDDDPELYMKDRTEYANLSHAKQIKTELGIIIQESSGDKDYVFPTRSKRELSDTEKNEMAKYFPMTDPDRLGTIPGDTVDFVTEVATGSPTAFAMYKYSASETYKITITPTINQTVHYLKAVLKNYGNLSVDVVNYFAALTQWECQISYLFTPTVFETVSVDLLSEADVNKTQKLSALSLAEYLKIIGSDVDLPDVRLTGLSFYGDLTARAQEKCVVSFPSDLPSAYEAIPEPKTASSSASV
jgi:hypothetical protein